MNALKVTERSAVYALQGAAAPTAVDTFDLLASAPRGVAKLREFILDLAVRGQLLAPHCPGPSVNALLQRVHEARKKLVAAGLIKVRRPRGTVHEPPFKLPHDWKWVTLDDVCATLTDGDHLPPPRVNAGVPFLVIGDVRSGRVNVAGASRFVPRSYFEGLDWSRRPQAGDILYTTVGSYGIPVPLMDSADFSFQRHIALLRPALSELQAFLALALASPFVFSQATAAATGTAQKTVPLSALRTIQIPLPPLAEQRCIVARVEELIGLCRELEEHGRVQDEQHARLVSTLFNGLVASESPQELAENWRRVAGQFDLLLDRPEAVDALEQTILQLAVRGLLVPQDPIDEPASKLLHKIRSCRTRLRSPASNGHATSQDRGASSLPAGWEAVGLLDVCSVGGGATPSKSNPKYWHGDVPWVSPKDMKVDVIGDTQDHVSPQALNETCLPLVTKGSVLVVVRGMILAHSFPVAVTAREVTLNQDMKSFTPYLDGLSGFLALALKGFKSEILALVARSTHGTRKLESDKLFSFTFGLPPLAEQHRILVRVEELRGLCAELRKRLREAQATQSHLADALVTNAAT